MTDLDPRWVAREVERMAQTWREVAGALRYHADILERIHVTTRQPADAVPMPTEGEINAYNDALNACPVCSRLDCDRLLDEALDADDGMDE
jgi:hypothetical protein